MHLSIVLFHCRNSVSFIWVFFCYSLLNKLFTLVLIGAAIKYNMNGPYAVVIVGFAYNFLYITALTTSEARASR